MRKLLLMLTNNIGWKIVSVFLGALLWLVCMNITNPVDTQIFNISLVIENKGSIAENDLTLQNESELSKTTVNIKIRATRNDISELKKQQSKLSAYIDLKPINFSMSDKIGEQLPVDINIQFPYGLTESKYEIISKEPKNVNIVLDKIETHTHSVNITASGEPLQDYITLVPESDTLSVTVNGPRLEINKIYDIRFVVDVSDAVSDIEKTGKVIAYDSKGNELSGNFTISPDTITVKVPVLKTGKLYIDANFSGNPASGFRASGIENEPFITVMGNTESIDKLNQRLKLEKVDITNAESNVSMEYYIPAYLLADESFAGISLMDESSNYLTVTVIIEEEIKREFVIPISDVRVRGMVKDTILPESVSVTLLGVNEDLNGITDEHIIANIDLTGLEPGEHRVHVGIRLSNPNQSVSIESPDITVLIPEQLETIDPQEGQQDENPVNPQNSGDANQPNNDDQTQPSPPANEDAEDTPAFNNEDIPLNLNSENSDN